MKDPEVSLLIDSKGLYDALNNELPQDDKKVAVEIPIIERIMSRMKGRSRWIPHNCNPSDALTKLKGTLLGPTISGQKRLNSKKELLQRRMEAEYNV